MPFVDLEDEFLTEQGIYQVKIKTSVGIDRLANASLTKHGFLLISDNLLNDEYIYCWWRD